MVRCKRTRRGGAAFTLVELLVVIAILAILVTMLIPYLTRAREVARRAVCMSNIRNIAEAGMGFANMHGGRGPGGGGRYVTSTGTEDSGLGWTDVLNVEYYRNSYETICRGIWNWPLRPETKTQLLCPNAKLYMNRMYVMPYQWNLDAVGGPDWGGNPAEGPYGLALDPAKLNYLYFPGSSTWYLGQYHLGAMLEKFPRPHNVFLTIEAEHANGTFQAPWPYSPASPIMNTQANIPPWCGGVTDGSDYFGFRHTLPPDVGLYKQQATACFSFMDGHVAIVNPNMDLNVGDHYWIRPDQQQ